MLTRLWSSKVWACTEHFWKSKKARYMSLGVHYDIWQKFTIFVEEDLCYVSLPVPAF